MQSLKKKNKLLNNCVELSVELLMQTLEIPILNGSSGGFVCTCFGEMGFFYCFVLFLSSKLFKQLKRTTTTLSLYLHPGECRLQEQNKIKFLDTIVKDGRRDSIHYLLARRVKILTE